MSTPAAQGKRLHWPELPADVRAAVAAVAGAAIADAQTQPHGFSPGVAARLRLADGQRAFVKVVFVDWPWGARGAPLLDVVGLAPSVRMQGGPDLDWLLARHPAAAAGGRHAANSLLAAVAGMFTSRALQPPPPGLPTLRAFQDAQGRVAREMLAARLGNP